MEQNTKNFDRNIERMMNEHEVAPPFGMWNRISSELEAMPVVVAAGPPVATALIPKRALVGIIAAVLVIGATIGTDYMINRNNKNTQVNTTLVNAPVATVKNVTKGVTTEQTIPVKHSVIVSPAVVLNQPAVKHTAPANPVQSTILAAKQVQPVVNQPVAENKTNESATSINNNAEVPTPIQPIAQTGFESNQNYYFPPIDGNSTAKENNSLAVAKNRIADLVPYTGDERPRNIGSKGKFHPKKRQKFTYGNIVR